MRQLGSVRRRWRSRWSLQALCALVPLSLLASEAAAQCDPGGGMGGLGPDLAVTEIIGVSNYGHVGEVYAYSLGVTVCNIGTEEVQWSSATPAHPVFAQQLYRWRDGRFEQIGLSWLKHGFSAGAQECCGCVPSGTPARLGVGCSDTYTSGWNGHQPSLGPRSELNPSTGEFPYPPELDAPIVDDTSRRLQAFGSDLDPALNEGALYFAELHVVAADEAAALNGKDNVSYRPVTVGSTSGSFPLTLVDETVLQRPALQAWPTIDPDVLLETLEIPGDGRLLLATRVFPRGDGSWHYEYALYNQDSHGGIRSFTVPLGEGISIQQIGFHGVAHHSGEPVENAGWEVSLALDSVSWGTDSAAENENAPALRWGMLFNFRFDSTSPPAPGEVTLAPFRSGFPPEWSVSSLVPTAENGPFVRGDANGDAQLDLGDAITMLAGLFGGPTPSCLDACDANDDGAFDVGDPIALLDHLFRAGSAPPFPGSSCGDDPTADPLGCQSFPPCP